MIYVPLRVISHYSVLKSIIKPKELIEFAKNQHFPSIALTDINNIFAGAEFSFGARYAKYPAILGCSIQTNHGIITLFCKNANGYKNLCNLLSDFYMIHNQLLPLENIYLYSQDLLCITGNTDGALKQHAERNLNILLNAFGDDFFLELNRTNGKDPNEHELAALSQKYNIACVGTSVAFFLSHEHAAAYMAMQAIDSNEVIVDENKADSNTGRLLTSAEMLEKFHDCPIVLENTITLAKKCTFLLEPLKPKFASFSQNAQSMLLVTQQAENANTHGASEAAEQKDTNMQTENRITHNNAVDSKQNPQNNSDLSASITANNSIDINKQMQHAYLQNQAQNEDNLLKQWAQEGLLEHFQDASWFALIKDRYESIEQAKITYQKRLDYELEMIIKLGFSGYFLIVADFVAWARGQKISLSARGSGAGSLVAWALKIIIIDPIYFGLFFERFINPGRVSLPDFDIDFCQERRNEVIDYVTEKYSKDFVAHIITFGMWHSRGVLRDVGRVLNIPYKLVDYLCKLIPNKPNFSLTLSEALDFDVNLKEQYNKDDKIKKLFDISMQLEGNNRNIGTHAAGIVIGWDKLKNLIPLYWTKDMQLPATGYTMKYIEQASLVKFDFLGLTALTIIDKTILLLNKHIDIQHIDIKDQNIFKLLCKGLTAGIFQFESVGLTNTIKKLQPTTLDELIAIISLYRPGPMENIDLYIANKKDTTHIEYIFSELADILKETFGIIIYQEQVISIAKVLADYTLSEADILRRAMGKKNPQEMSEQRDKFTFNIIIKKYKKHFGQDLTLDKARECVAIYKYHNDKKLREEARKQLEIDPIYNMELTSIDATEHASSTNAHQMEGLKVQAINHTNVLFMRDMPHAEAYQDTSESTTMQQQVSSTSIAPSTDAPMFSISHTSDQMYYIQNIFYKATDLFDQIVKFSGYAFNKAHAVSHTFIGYQTAYLKVYYPLEFMSVSLSMEQDKHDKIAMLYKELTSLNLKMLAPDVNYSTTIFNIMPPNQILYGLACVKSIGAVLVEDIINERSKGLFSSIEDLCKRVRLSQTTIEAMIFSGALDNLKIYKADDENAAKSSHEQSENVTLQEQFSHETKTLQTIEDKNHTYEAKTIEDKNHIFIDRVSHRSNVFHQIDNLLHAHGLGIFTNLSINKTPLTTQHILLMEYKYLGIVLHKELLKTLIDYKTEIIISDQMEKHKKNKEIYVSGLLLDKQIIKTKKNTIQYILQIADIGSTFEVFINSEIYEMANVSIGDVIICQIILRNQYWIGEKIFQQTNTIRNLQIHITSQSELHTAKSFADSLIPGATKCLLQIHSNPMRTLELNHYHITTKHFGQLNVLGLKFEINID